MTRHPRDFIIPPIGPIMKLTTELFRLSGDKNIQRISLKAGLGPNNVTM